MVPFPRVRPGRGKMALLLATLGCPQLLDDSFGAPPADASAPFGAPEPDAALGSDSGAAGSGDSGRGTDADTGQPECPQDAAQGPGGRCFVVVQAQLSWFQGRARCRARGSGWDLASIRNDDQTTFVRQLLTGETWIGATDQATDGVWLWVIDDSELWRGDGTTGQPANGAYANWNPDEPNGSGSCVRVLTTGLWADWSCADPYASLCEGPTE